MQYRGFEYSVVPGFGWQIWRWSVHFDASHTVTGQAAMKSAAVVLAEQAIDRELLSRRLRLVSLVRES
jgi:hypothetical protein